MNPLTDMLILISSFVTGLIIQFGYLGIFITMALESAAMPVPSEIIMPFAGYVVFQGKLDLLLVLAAGTLGNLVGSVILYYVGLLGGRPLLIKYGKYVLISEKEIKRAEAWFKKYGTKAVFFSRMLPVVRTFSSLPAGTARMDFKKFCLYTVAGSVPWNLALLYIGVLLGKNWQEIEGVLRILDIVIIIGIIAVIAYFVRHLLKTRR